MKTRRNTINRRQLKEAFIRGYRAGKKRLHEGIAETKEITQAVKTFLNKNLPKYDDEMEEYIITKGFEIDLKNGQCDGQEEFNQAITKLDDSGKKHILSQQVSGLTERWGASNPESENEPMIRELKDIVTRTLLKYAKAL